MPSRKPQINFQVERAMKLLYEEAKEQGHWVTRFCAAGFLAMVEDPAFRTRAISRLRDWEAEYEDASESEIRDFVEGAHEAMQRGSQGSRPARPAQPKKKRTKRGKS